jgi:hypothetical protein
VVTVFCGDVVAVMIVFVVAVLLWLYCDAVVTVLLWLNVDCVVVAVL